MEMTRRIFTAGVSLALLAAVCGCRKDPHGESRGAEQFLGADETSAATRLADAQAAAGARTDATLRPYHFDHGRLNTLGRDKLDQMVAGLPAEGELDIYLDVQEVAVVDNAPAHNDEVESHLSSRGLERWQFRLHHGSNPDNTFSAASAMPEKAEPKSGLEAFTEALGTMMTGAAPPAK